jgi:hypothetical protein
MLQIEGRIPYKALIQLFPQSSLGDSACRDGSNQLESKPRGSRTRLAYQIIYLKHSRPLPCTVHSWPKVGPLSCQEEHSTSHSLPLVSELQPLSASSHPLTVSSLQLACFTATTANKTTIKKKGS